MKALASIAALALVAAAPAPAGRVRLQLDALPVSELVTILYRDVLRVPYVVAPEVSTDRRTVSIRLDASPEQARAQVVAYLHAMGLTVNSVAGVDQITSAGGMGLNPAGNGVYSPASASPVSGAPAMAFASPAAPAAKPAPLAVGYYHPRYRDPAYIADVLRGVFPGLKFGTRQQTQSEQGTVDLANAPDLLVFAGTDEDVAKARELVGQLDTQQAELDIKATVYEVQTGHTNQSALSVALNVLGGKLLGGYLTGGASTALDTFAHLHTKNVDAVVSALNSDNRFRVVTSPSLRTRSGAQATLTSGSQVPVLGAVTYEGAAAQPVQSVEYRDSGVILKVRPIVHRDVIDLDVSQEISSFAKTDTGVNGSPTLNKRSLDNQLSMQSGDVVVIGGLTQDSNTVAHSGLLKGFLGTRTKETARTEVLLVLQVTSSRDGVPSARSDSEDGRQPVAPRSPLVF